jgi:hypothetical protein
MMRVVKLAISKEEKVAQKISALLSDFTLDIEAVGFYLAKATPYVIYRRAVEILESAEFQKNQVEYNLRSKFYSDRVS